MIASDKIYDSVLKRVGSPDNVTQNLILYDKVVAEVRFTKYKAKRIRKQEKRILRRKILYLHKIITYSLFLLY